MCVGVWVLVRVFQDALSTSDSYKDVVCLATFPSFSHRFHASTLSSVPDLLWQICHSQPAFVLSHPIQKPIHLTHLLLSLLMQTPPWSPLRRKTCRRSAFKLYLRSLSWVSRPVEGAFMRPILANDTSNTLMALPP